MTCSPDHSRQRGTVFTEAAVVMPLLLLVSFASIFFFLVAANSFAVQMVANDVARVAALSLSREDPTGGGCTLKCREKHLTSDEVVDLNTFKNTHMQCFSDCASSQYLLRGDSLVITLSPVPVGVQNGTNLTNEVTPGDIVRISVQYPTSAVIGSRIPMLGALDANSKLEGSALAVVERP